MKKHIDFLLIIALGFGTFAIAAEAENCPPGSTHPACVNEREQVLAQERAQEAILREQAIAQERSRQEAVLREQAVAQERARQEALMHEQAIAQERARQEAIQREQAIAQEEAVLREQAVAQERARQEALMHEQAIAHERARQEAIQREQAIAQERARQEAVLHERAMAQERARQEAVQREQALAKEHANQEAALREEAKLREQEKMRQQEQAHEQARLHEQEQERLREQELAQRRESAREQGLHPAISAGSPVPPSQPGAMPPHTINPSTTVHPDQEHGGLTIQHKRADGSEWVVHSSTLPNGQHELNTYKLTENPHDGTQTRTYTDGLQITTGKDFVTRSAPGQLSLTTHKDGLREAHTPDGGKVFQERYADRRDADGNEHRVIERTVYTEFIGGNTVVLEQPIVDVYQYLPYQGVPLYLYEPVVFAPITFDWFMQAFPTPWNLISFCPECLVTMPVYPQPVVAYRDPLDLFTDMQIAGGFYDGSYYPMQYPQSVSPYQQAQIADLRAQVGDLQQELNAVAASNSDLRAQLDAQRFRTAELQSIAPSSQTPQPAATPTKVSMPEAVRQQIRKQVKEDINLHRKQKPLALPDIIASAEAQNYIFQVSEFINATEVDTDKACILTTGDLIKFERSPEAGKPVARMKVVTGKAGSCQAGTVIQVSLSDVQEMLNGFSQRLERNLTKVHDKLATKSPAGAGQGVKN